MFTRRRRTVRIHPDSTGRRLGRAALGLVGTAGLNTALAVGALGAGALARKYGRVSPLKILRAAGQLHPELKGTVKLVRGGPANMSGPGAFTEQMIPRRKGKEARQMAADMVDLVVRKGSRRRRLVLIARKPFGLPMGHLGGSPILSHELGHLADRGRRPFSAGRTASLSRLREEWRATAHGAKIHRRAGGNRLAYWGTTLPAFGSYVTMHPAFGAGMAGLGAASGGPRKERRRRR